MMILNDPETFAEVTAAFRAYETALREEDVSTLDTMFHDSPFTVRFGDGEALYGADAIAAARRARSGPIRRRRVDQVVVATYGRHVGTVDAEFTRDDDDRHGRLSQTWVRFVDGWKIVSTHLSVDRVFA
jgi:hypothetical protein